MPVSMSDDDEYRTLDFENPQDHADVDRVWANVIVPGGMNWQTLLASAVPSQTSIVKT